MNSIVDVRVGTVSDINTDQRQARAFFPDTSIMSGWLKIVKTSDTDWLPSIGDVVLCLYESGFNGNGYIVGVL